GQISFAGDTAVDGLYILLPRHGPAVGGWPAPCQPHGQALGIGSASRIPCRPTCHGYGALLEPCPGYSPAFPSHPRRCASAHSRSYTADLQARGKSLRGAIRVARRDVWGGQALWFLSRLFYLAHRAHFL